MLLQAVVVNMNVSFDYMAPLIVALQPGADHGQDDPATSGGDDATGGPGALGGEANPGGDGDSSGGTDLSGSVRRGASETGGTGGTGGSVEALASGARTYRPRPRLRYSEPTSPSPATPKA